MDINALTFASLSPFPGLATSWSYTRILRATMFASSTIVPDRQL